MTQINNSNFQNQQDSQLDLMYKYVENQLDRETKKLNKIRKIEPFFTTYFEYNPKDIADIFKSYNSNNPSSLKVKDESELNSHIKFMDWVLTRHYKFGEKNMSDFPNFKCVLTSKNLLYTFLKYGYHNTNYVYDSEHDHAYNIFPFVNEQNKKQGIILVDGTSDQLHIAKSQKIKNKIEVIYSPYWRYNTNWADGANLFPNQLINLESIFNGAINETKYEKSFLNNKFKFMKQYLTKCWDNPISFDKMKISLDEKLKNNYK